METLSRLEFRSIFEVGCGSGRITRLVHQRWPGVQYTAIDLSLDRLMSARARAPRVEFIHSMVQSFRPHRTWDLVLAVEVLMHIPASDIASVIDRLFTFARRNVVTLDWAVPIDRPIAPWNDLHDYAELYGKRLLSVEQVGLQAIYVGAP